MINVSAEFIENMRFRSDFKQYAEITLLDGAEWLLDETDFSISNNFLNDSAEANELPLGEVVGRTIQIEISNKEEQFKNVSFFGARIRMFLTFELSGSTEEVELGIFTVITPETYGETIIISATDDVWKLDTPYTTKLIFPQTIGAIFRDVCTSCGVPFSSSQFNNYDFVVDEAPTQEITNRQMVGYIAMIAGGNARFNRFGYLEIITYTFPEYTVFKKDIDGGNFTDWNSGDNIDGGSFTDWLSGDKANGGVFRPWDNHIPEIEIKSTSTHLLTEWINLRHDTEDVVVTGVKTTAIDIDADGNELPPREVFYGSNGYVISFENPLILGKTDEAATLIGNVLIGAKIRKFEGDYIAYPIAEFMDKAVVVNRKGEVFGTVLTNVSFAFFGNTTLQNSAASPVRQNSQYNGAAAQAIIEAKKLIRKEKTQRELALEKLNATLENSSGLYLTEEPQPDGSAITYLHDKPSLDESQTVIKRTAEAIGISNDGGVNYDYGLFFSGDAVLRTLDAEGVNAGWIRTGSFLVTDPDGNTTFSADYATGRVFMSGEVDVLTTNAGYEFGRDGLKISKPDSEMATRIDDDGMDVSRSGENVLSADSTGVNAVNLTARQYLTVGDNSRFEDYKQNRTACFYIGVGGDS